MCGRFSLTVQEDEIERLFDVAVDRRMYVPRYNGAPSQNMLVIFGGESRQSGMMRWGLVPSWAKDPGIGNKLINARSETVMEKPSFRQAFRHRRCIVPADGFYEWKRDGKKIPYRFVMKDKGLFALAGIWEKWTDPEGRILMSFCLLTTTPNEIMEGIHDRMPVILHPEKFETYLNARGPEQILEMLIPFPAEKMLGFQVSTLVNSPRNNDERVMAPVQDSDSGLF